MYGIMSADGERILCQSIPSRSFPDIVILKIWDRAHNPIMIESAMEIDQLLQKCMVGMNDYNLKVFEFTKEQEANMIMNRLRGY